MSAPCGCTPGHRTALTCFSCEDSRHVERVGPADGAHVHLCRECLAIVAAWMRERRVELDEEDRVG